MTRFLIVDNAAAVRMALAKHIMEIEHFAEVKEATTTRDALAIVAAWRPNLIFTGMGLADAERGLPLVAELLRRDPSASIVLCTSMPITHADVAEALSLGAFAYLPKPVRGEALRHVIDEWSSERGGLRRVK